MFYKKIFKITSIKKQKIHSIQDIQIYPVLPLIGQKPSINLLLTSKKYNEDKIFKITKYNLKKELKVRILIIESEDNYKFKNLLKNLKKYQNVEIISFQKKEIRLPLHPEDIFLKLNGEYSDIINSLPIKQNNII